MTIKKGDKVKLKPINCHCDECEQGVREGVGEVFGINREEFGGKVFIDYDVRWPSGHESRMRTEDELEIIQFVTTIEELQESYELD